MRNVRRITVIGAALLTGVALPVHAPAQAARAPQVQLEGTIERLADSDAHAGASLRLPTGERLTLAPLAAAPAGGSVRVQVPVPADLARAIAAGREVPTLTGRARISTAELTAASSVPASSSSALAQAVVRDAVEDGAPVTASGVQVFARAMSTTGVNAAPAVHDLTVAIVRPRGLKSSVATTAQVAAQVKGADAYWREQSRGKVSLRAAKIASPYQSAFSCQDDPFRLWTEAARATGFVDGPNKHLVMVFPRDAMNQGCSYGLASMGQNLNAGGVAYVSDTAWPVLAHEIGHNLGLAHAKALLCRSATDAPLTSSACGIEEYGDPFDVMAASSQDNAGSLSLPQAVRVGIAGPKEFVDAGEGSRTVTLSAVSTLSGVRAVRVRDPRTGAIYWVEYRARTRRDARLYQSMAAGVRVLREENASDGPWPSSVALDPTPTGSSRDAARALRVGGGFLSYGRGVSVLVKAVKGETATVVVSASSKGLAAPTAGRIARRAAVARPVVAPRLSVNRKGVATWTAVAGGSGRYDVAVRTVRGRTVSATKTWLPGTTRRSAKITGRKGTTVQLRVRARGAAGSSPWSGWTSVAFR